MAVLAWRAGPLGTLVQVLLTVVAGALPVIAAWLTKLVLDGLAAPGTAASVVVPAMALAVIGVLTALVPQAKQFAQAELGRSVALRASDNLFAALSRLVGLARCGVPGKPADQAGGRRAW